MSAKTNAIAYLRKHLVEYYTTVTCQIQRKPWDPYDFADLKSLYTNILIHYVNRNTGENRKEILPGSVNDVFVVKLNDMLPKRIVMLAPAGRGKTCCVAKMAYDWSHQVEISPLRNIPLFFALKMRAIEEDMSLGEAILAEPLGGIGGVTPDSLEEFIGRHEDDSVLALDGYDESKIKMSSVNSKSNICPIMRNKKFRGCRTVVTCRPYLETDFMESEIARAYTKMEIEGFTESQKTSYVKKYFLPKPDPQEADKLLQFLQENDMINDLTRVPLFCTMICHLWEEDLLKDVSTLTSLFDNTIQFLLAHANSKEIFTSDCDTVLQALGQVALNGLLEDGQKLVFEDSDFEEIREEEAGAIKLGIITKQTIPVRRLTLGKTSRSYVEFFHKLAQEYCAGRFLSNNPESLQQFFKKVNESPTPVMQQNVLRFLAGSGDVTHLRAIQHGLENDDGKMSKGRKQRLFLDCVSECAKASKTCLPNFFTHAGELLLWAVTYSTVQGLDKLPKSIKDQVI